MHQLNSKIMVQFCYFRLYLGIETFILLSVAKDGKDGHGLSCEPTFSSFSAMSAKIIEKILSWLVLPDAIFLRSSS